MTVDNEPIDPDRPTNIVDAAGTGDPESETRQRRRERLAQETRSPELCLWLDLETAGRTGRPDAQNDTVLECAWMITYRQPPEHMRFRTPDYRRGGRIDLTDWQLTPLRSRLCLIGGQRPTAQVPCFPSPEPVAPNGTTPKGWRDSGLSEFVQEMHDASGLTAEHMAANLADRLIDHEDTLTRLILDDVQAAQAHAQAARAGDPAGLDDEGRPRPLTLYIAGDGVGHYDQPLLQRGQFHRLARCWHYRPHDISHALHAVSPVRHPVQTVLASYAADRWIEVLSAGLDVDPRIDLVGGAGPEVIRRWLTTEGVDHRAAADVLAAVVADLTTREALGERLTVELH